MNRQSAVLMVLAAANGAALTPVQLQKACFLLTKNAPGMIDRPGFNFEPYDYGPFDKAVYDEAVALSLQGLVQINQAANGRWNVYAVTQAGLESGKLILHELTANMRSFIEQTVAWVRAQSFSGLVKSVYKAYPEMKANSVFRD